jgi:hypothetical protein
VRLATTTTVQGRARSRTAAIAIAAMLSTSVVAAVGASSASAGGPASAAQSGSRSAHPPLYLNPNQPVAQRVRDLMSRMTLDEKIGQLTQAERGCRRRPEQHHHLEPGQRALRRRIDPGAEHTQGMG